MPIVKPEDKREYIQRRKTKPEKIIGAFIPYVKRRSEALKLLNNGTNQFYLITEVYEFPETFKRRPTKSRIPGFKAEFGYKISTASIMKALDIAEATANQHRDQFIVYFDITTPDIGRNKGFIVRNRTEKVAQDIEHDIFEAEAFDDGYITRERYDV